MSTQPTPEHLTPDTTLYSITEVAERLKVSVKTVRRWIATSEIVAHRFGRQLRISKADLSTFICLHREER